MERTYEHKCKLKFFKCQNMVKLICPTFYWKLLPVTKERERRFRNQQKLMKEDEKK